MEQTSNNSFKVAGILDIHPKGFGFLRQKQYFYSESPSDIYVTVDFIRRKRLKPGIYIEGEGETGKEGNNILKSINTLNGMPFEKYLSFPPFNKLVSVSPDEILRLETPNCPLSMRIVDILAPIGKGSRSLVISPPKVGKTTFLKEIANSCAINHPEIQIFALLIDERPEEVTDIQRSIKGEVIASSMDQSLINHVRLSRLSIEIAKRKVEEGKDVLIIMDSITRMSRAFNTIEGESGRTMSGGLDSRAMEFPRYFFGSARKIENGGSLTIVATTLVDTGSRMDELIFREFQGTGNQEIQLSRKLSDKRIFPAMDLQKSRTRKEELLLTPDELLASTRIRRGLADLHPDIAMERLIDTMKKFKTNREFVDMLLNAKVK
ncbi:MAG: hypothetical protein ACD_79C01375G0002 [uncultured bacterium]|nr:MAG: hypothetical protein ACD_79C01375G0002 [uncultured bacterium]